jgi:phenylpropionate dioxygenase-like ring-hydroxylating dioxygenase large terminal subunit
MAKQGRSMNPASKCTDPIILNLWHVIGDVSEMQPDIVYQTVLLEERVSFTIDAAGTPFAWRSLPSDKSGEAFDPARVPERLPARCAYGCVWTSLGQPAADIFPIPEYAEAKRRNVNAGTIGVCVSAPRAIENFLDMGHFPYVHTDVLGAEPHTEVKEYDVEISADRDEIVATRCRFFQPKASIASTEGGDIEYVYRVPHPYCSVLYKTSHVDENRLDVIGIFAQPIDQEHIRAHMMLCLVDEDNNDTAIRHFQQLIFGQDKPILENQFPKRLPLDPRAETPIRADKSSVAYRRWLSQKGVTYGVIPAAG